MLSSLEEHELLLQLSSQLAGKMAHNSLQLEYQGVGQGRGGVGVDPKPLPSLGTAHMHKPSP